MYKPVLSKLKMSQCSTKMHSLHSFLPPPTAFPLTLVLFITIPVGTVLVAVVLLLLCLCCALSLRRHAQIGKHTPLMEEHAFEKQKKKKLRQKTYGLVHTHTNMHTHTRICMYTHMHIPL